MYVFKLPQRKDMERLLGECQLLVRVLMISSIFGNSVLGNERRGIREPPTLQF